MPRCRPRRHTTGLPTTSLEFVVGVKAVLVYLVLQHWRSRRLGNLGSLALPEKRYAIQRLLVSRALPRKVTHFSSSLFLAFISPVTFTKACRRMPSMVSCTVGGAFDDAFVDV